MAGREGQVGGGGRKGIFLFWIQKSPSINVYQMRNQHSSP